MCYDMEPSEGCVCVQNDGSCEAKTAGNKHVQFCLENNQTFEFECHQLKMDGEQNESLSKEEENTANGVEKQHSQLYHEEEELEECRRLFRQQMKELNLQLESFRKQCNEEISQLKQNVEDQKQLAALELDELDQQLQAKKNQKKEQIESEIKDIEANHDLVERQKEVLAMEQKLLEKEDEIAQRQKNLIDYEKEVEEIEGYLDRRMELCNKRESELKDLDTELASLRSDLDKEKEELLIKGGTEDEIKQERAKINCSNNRNFLQKSLLDKQTTTELALKRCRAEIEELKDSLSKRDNQVSELKKEICNLNREIEKKSQRVKALESHLSFTLDEVNRKNAPVVQTRRLSAIQASQDLTVLRSLSFQDGGTSSSGSSCNDQENLSQTFPGRTEQKRKGTLVHSHSSEAMVDMSKSHRASLPGSSRRKSIHERGRRYTLTMSEIEPLPPVSRQSMQYGSSNSNVNTSPTKRKDDATKFEYENSGRITSSTCMVM
ncbi:putative leucine-rich repeat-containing protein DDB_G0290503 [Lingula anatina]|uniref:Leucine-rich repeat-containing protein DDB_G0290503 n=1 Tax=Lingula anatina TaxID=7574 RepID=A0A1S3KE21_LINAN|nr:putative leucine-rich repeat-containing protein DDB_G0290503 [Lingula anatina]|eukprot:XP_013420873.1 putative leucine-rich repeat-containing protein DDB_G0290503 [Lingula anatina]